MGTTEDDGLLERSEFGTFGDAVDAAVHAGLVVFRDPTTDRQVAFRMNCLHPIRCQAYALGTGSGIVPVFTWRSLEPLGVVRGDIVRGDI